MGDLKTINKTTTLAIYLQVKSLHLIVRSDTWLREAFLLTYCIYIPGKPGICFH